MDVLYYPRTKTSGLGEIPYRRYTPQANAGTGEIPVATVRVWMEEGFFYFLFLYILRVFCDILFFI